MAGGAIMAALLPVYTILHGPTSVYERGEWLGVEGQVWGGWMSSAPSLLIAAGLIGARAAVTGEGRAARVGYALVLVSLLVPGVLDLVLRAISPPMLMPVEAAGLLLLGLSSDHSAGPARAVRRAFVGIGCLLGTAFAIALVPQDVSDAHGLYRVFGVVGYMLVGIGWIVAGAAVTKQATSAHGESP